LEPERSIPRPSPPAARRHHYHRSPQRSTIEATTRINTTPPAALCQIKKAILLGMIKKNLLHTLFSVSPAGPLFTVKLFLFKLLCIRGGIMSKFNLQGAGWRLYFIALSMRARLAYNNNLCGAGGLAAAMLC